MEILSLADDLTGALEVGGKFAMWGLSALVCTRPGLSRVGRSDPHQALVVDTETRHVSADLAFDVVRELAGSLSHPGMCCLFKKTDSTLRGNIAAELSAVKASFPDSPLFYVAAYPSMGRTVRKGTLYVDGSPVSRTAFACDAMNPVLEAHIPTMLRPRLQSVSIVPAQAAHARDAVVYVIDGETEDHVRLVASALASSTGFLLAAGPAAFAGYLAELSPLLPGERAGSAFGAARPERCLVVNGSLHPAAQEQMRVAISQGWTICEPENVTAEILNSGWTILQLPISGEKQAIGFAARLGETVSGILSRVQLDAMVVLGGDTAHEIVAALGHPPLLAEGEVVPGVPVARIRRDDLSRIARPRRDLLVITKAGGFGRPDVLLHIRERAARS
jgi:uncharacterized protein YgbK (DUF1537 family)